MDRRKLLFCLCITLVLNLLLPDSVLAVSSAWIADGYLFLLVQVHFQASCLVVDLRICINLYRVQYEFLKLYPFIKLSIEFSVMDIILVVIGGSIR